MTGSTFHYCGCRDQTTGKQLGKACPQLSNSRHRRWGYVRRIPTTEKPAWQLYRRGFPTMGAAEEELGRVADLLKVAGDDDRVRARIGDMIREKTRRGGQLPSKDEVRLRLGAGDRLDQVQTVGEYLDGWLAGKRRLKASTKHSYTDHVQRIWKPLLGDIALERLRREHVDRAVGVLLQQETNRKAAGKVLSPASVRRYLGTLSSAMTEAVDARRLQVNPAHRIELPRVRRKNVAAWTPAEAGQFLDAHPGERLLALFELVMVEGLRRAEVCGLRWCDVALGDDEGMLTIQNTRIGINGLGVVEDDPKSEDSTRRVPMGAHSVAVLTAWRLRQQLEAAEWGAGWTDSGYVFTYEDGRPLLPDYVSHRFERLVGEVEGLRRIRLHDLRHTAASLTLGQDVDRAIVSKRLGHSDPRFTDRVYSHLYDAVGREASDAAAAAIQRQPRTAV